MSQNILNKILSQTFWVPVSAWNGVSRRGWAKRGWMTDRDTRRRVCVESECNFTTRASDFLCRGQ
ncbi:mCG1033179 [Mus musculus]|nr:mCG1033179 [Mus musculus]